MEAYNQNVTVKMNELNALLQKVTEQVHAFDRIVAESASNRAQRGHTEAFDSLARDGKAKLYIGFYNISTKNSKTNAAGVKMATQMRNAFERMDGTQLRIHSPRIPF
jgi:hypothetical protein